MRENVDLAAARHAYLHADFALLTWEPAAIPVYAVTSDLLLQRDKRFPPIDEFVLEAVDAGLTTLEDLEGFLGLESHVVSYAVTKQLLLDNVVFEHTDSTGGSVLRLTPPGKEALRTLRFTVPSREPYRFTFDRLLWQPIPGRHVDLLRRREVNDGEMLVLPRAERRTLVPADISTSELGRIVNRYDRSKEHVDVLAVSGLPRQDARYLEAVLLVFGSNQGELRFEVIVDGVVSPRHSEALARDGRAQALGYEVAPSPGPPQLHGGLQRQLAPLSLVSGLNQQAAAARRLMGPGGDAKPAPDSRSEPSLPTEPEKQLAALPVRSLESHEHRLLLRQAVTHAKRRLLISTLSVTRAVVDEEFLRLLSSRLEHSDIEARLAWSKGAGPLRERDVEALADLQTLARKHSALTVRIVSDPGSTSLIWDDHWIESSFDWLGHVGGASRSVRADDGVLVRIPEEVDARYAALIAAGQAPPTG